MKRLFIKGEMKFIFTFIILLSFPISKSLGQYLMTVTGKMLSNKVHNVLAHEHVVTNFAGAETVRTSKNIDSALVKSLPYFKALKASGINVVFECTPAYIGRDVLLLKKLSELSEINIVTNTGFYTAVDKKYLPAFVHTESEETIAQRWEDEFKHGIEGTGIRPGFIKLGVGDGAIDSIESKLLRAAIRVSKTTGLTIVNHTGNYEAAQSEYDLAVKEGLSPDKMVWTHAQNATDAERKLLAEKGMWISLDGVSDLNLDVYVASIIYMKENKLLDRLLISHDDGLTVIKNGSYGKLELFKMGDSEPYLTITKKLIPLLKDRRFTQSDIDQMMTVNPVRCFSLKN